MFCLPLLGEDDVVCTNNDTPDNAADIAFIGPDWHWHMYEGAHSSATDNQDGWVWRVEECSGGSRRVVEGA